MPDRSVDESSAPASPIVTLTGGGPCAACGHDPACGFASTHSEAKGEQWWCHDDGCDCDGPLSCYEQASWATPAQLRVAFNIGDSGDERVGHHPVRNELPPTSQEEG